MENHTDLEKKLFEYILFMIGLINVYEKSFQLIYGHLSNVAKWTNKNWEVLERYDKYHDMIGQLNKEFNWDITINDLNDNDIKETYVN
jgi:hypothetical protein